MKHLINLSVLQIYLYNYFEIDEVFHFLQVTPVDESRNKMCEDDKLPQNSTSFSNRASLESESLKLPNSKMYNNSGK